MKTTKKRLLLGIAGTAMLCAGAVFTTLAATAKPQITDETMLANIEALSQGESGQQGECWHVIRGDQSQKQYEKMYCGTCESRLCCVWSMHGGC